MCRRIRFSATVNFQKASITDSSENVPDSQSSADRWIKATHTKRFYWSY